MAISHPTFKQMNVIEIGKTTISNLIFWTDPMVAFSIQPGAFGATSSSHPLSKALATRLVCSCIERSAFHLLQLAPLRGPWLPPAPEGPAVKYTAVPLNARILEISCPVALGTRQLFERETIAKLQLPFLDLSKADRERLTLEAMARGEPLIYGGRIGRIRAGGPARHARPLVQGVRGLRSGRYQIRPRQEGRRR